jgi:DNA modification methylase
MNYQEFLLKKQKTHVLSGFQVGILNDHLFEFQDFIVRRALKAGKYAIWADCGLGKTIMQLEWAHRVNEHTGKPVLILCPLAVAGQTIKEGEKFEIEVLPALTNPTAGIQISNYDQLDNLDTSIYSGIVLDESSILKNFEGATKNLIIESFRNTPYKLACSATPSPNDPMEIGNHAEFLDVMSRNEMLAMYFVHDGGETAKWRLKGHAIKEFYRFIGTWAIMLNRPEDIGFHMDGYDLPSLNLIEKQIKTPKRNNGSLFNDAVVSATNFNGELRLTKFERLEEVVSIVNSRPDENFIIWVKQNEEGDALKKLVPGAIEVKGSDSPAYKEKMLLGFANNEFRILITKSKIAQFGLNYQNCRNQIFASLDFSFESLYQSIRRSYRFGQKNEVNIYMITTDTMSNVIQSINTKQTQFKVMQDEMSKVINEGLNTKNKQEREPVIFNDKNFSITLGDAFKLIKAVETGSIDTSIFSPPFSSLYTYSDSVADLSNVLSHDEFYQHFEYMIPELYRVLKSGRHIGMHLTQLTTGIAKDGHYSIIDFRGEVIRLFQKHGFLFHGEVTIWKNPELAAIRTKNHQLLHKSTKRDSAIVRPGLADYLVIMRKPGVNAEPINHNGEGIPFDKWCKIASPVWMDVNESDTLQGWRNGRDNKDERHITPTQLEVIENYLIMYSNPGDTVLTPFAGIGSEVYQAVKMGRKAIGFELKESYFDLMKKNLASLIEQKRQMELI